jgi:hypothetical protein
MALASTHVRYFDEPADIRTGEPLLGGAHSGLLVSSRKAGFPVPVL